MSIEPDRVAALVERLTHVLEDLVRQHGVTEAEWYVALEYLGQVVAADELILLSDVLGLSVLVDQLTHGSREGTPSSVLGPFWREAPDLPNPALLAPPDAPGEPLVLGGAVTGEDGEPVVGAKVDVWQCDADGRYDVQLADDRPRFRGVLTTDDTGRYELRTVVPPPYEVPKDGPVGKLLAALDRHAFRPAHIHFKVTAPRYADLTTMVFFAGDPWLGNDTINADRPDLTVPIDRDDPGPATATFNVVLSPPARSTTSE